MSNEALIADLRRLYLHILDGGQVNAKIDSARISRAIAVLERAEQPIMPGANADYYSRVLQNIAFLTDVEGNADRAGKLREIAEFLANV